MLTTGQLDRLKELWQREHAPVVEILRPGLPEEMIDAQVGELGLELPSEARTWWAWHNGAGSTEGLVSQRELGPGFAFLSLEEAIGLYRQMRALFERLWAPDGPSAVDHWWRPTWFPITERRAAVRCDCAVPAGAPTPIYWAYSHDHDVEGLTRPKVDSFGTLVTWWIEAVENGAWRFDRRAKRWVHHPDLLEPERERNGLV